MELALLVATAGAVGTTLASSGKAALPTLILVILVALIAVYVTHYTDPRIAIVNANNGNLCNAYDSTCPATKCAIQSIDNPFANPLASDFGSERFFAGECSTKRAETLLQARELNDNMVKYAESRRFHSVPTHDASDYRQWLYGVPDNCKHTQAACTVSPTIIDALR